MNMGTIITILTALFFGLILFHTLVGLSRGLRKSAFFFIGFATMVIIFWIIADPIADSIFSGGLWSSMNINTGTALDNASSLKEGLPDFIREQFTQKAGDSTLGERIASDAEMMAIINNLCVSIIKFLVLLFLFTVGRLIVLLVMEILWLFFKEKREVRESKKKRRLAGAGFGLAKGIMSAVLFISPITGIIRLASQIDLEKFNNVQTVEVKRQNEETGSNDALAMINELTQGYKNSFLGKFMDVLCFGDQSIDEKIIVSAISSNKYDSKLDIGAEIDNFIEIASIANETFYLTEGAEGFKKVDLQSDKTVEAVSDIASGLGNSYITTKILEIFSPFIVEEASKSINDEELKTALLGLELDNKNASWWKKELRGLGNIYEGLVDTGTNFNAIIDKDYSKAIEGITSDNLNQFVDTLFNSELVTEVVAAATPYLVHTIPNDYMTEPDLLIEKLQAKDAVKNEIKNYLKVVDALKAEEIIVDNKFTYDNLDIEFVENVVNLDIVDNSILADHLLAYIIRIQAGKIEVNGETIIVAYESFNDPNFTWKNELSFVITAAKHTLGSDYKLKNFADFNLSEITVNEVKAVIDDKTLDNSLLVNDILSNVVSAMALTIKLEDQKILHEEDVENINWNNELRSVAKGLVAVYDQNETLEQVTKTDFEQLSVVKINNLVESDVWNSSLINTFLTRVTDLEFKINSGESEIILNINNDEINNWQSEIRSLLKGFEVILESEYKVDYNTLVIKDITGLNYSDLHIRTLDAIANNDTIWQSNLLPQVLDTALSSVMENLVINGEKTSISADGVTDWRLELKAISIMIGEIYEQELGLSIDSDEATITKFETINTEEIKIRTIDEINKNEFDVYQSILVNEIFDEIIFDMLGTISINEKTVDLSNVNKDEVVWRDEIEALVDVAYSMTDDYDVPFLSIQNYFVEDETGSIEIKYAVVTNLRDHINEKDNDEYLLKVTPELGESIIKCVLNIDYEINIHNEMIMICDIGNQFKYQNDDLVYVFSTGQMNDLNSGSMEKTTCENVFEAIERNVAISDYLKKQFANLLTFGTGENAYSIDTTGWTNDSWENEINSIKYLVCALPEDEYGFVNLKDVKNINGVIPLSLVQALAVQVEKYDNMTVTGKSVTIQTIINKEISNVFSDTESWNNSTWDSEITAVVSVVETLAVRNAVTNVDEIDIQEINNLNSLSDETLDSLQTNVPVSISLQSIFKTNLVSSGALTDSDVISDWELEMNALIPVVKTLPKDVNNKLVLSTISDFSVISTTTLDAVSSKVEGNVAAVRSIVLNKNISTALESASITTTSWTSTDWNRELPAVFNVAKTLADAENNIAISELSTFAVVKYTTLTVVSENINVSIVLQDKISDALGLTELEKTAASENGWSKEITALNNVAQTIGNETEITLSALDSFTSVKYETLDALSLNIENSTILIDRVSASLGLTPEEKATATANTWSKEIDAVTSVSRTLSGTEDSIDITTLDNLNSVSDETLVSLQTNVPVSISLQSIFKTNLVSSGALTDSDVISDWELEMNALIPVVKTLPKDVNNKLVLSTISDFSVISTTTLDAVSSKVEGNVAAVRSIVLNKNISTALESASITTTSWTSTDWNRELPAVFNVAKTLADAENNIAISELSTFAVVKYTTLTVVSENINVSIVLQDKISDALGLTELEKTAASENGWSKEITALNNVAQTIGNETEITLSALDSFTSVKYETLDALSLNIENSTILIDRVSASLGLTPEEKATAASVNGWNNEMAALSAVAKTLGDGTEVVLANLNEFSKVSVTTLNTLKTEVPASTILQGKFMDSLVNDGVLSSEVEITNWTLEMEGLIPVVITFETSGTVVLANFNDQMTYIREITLVSLKERDANDLVAPEKSIVLQTVLTNLFKGTLDPTYNNFTINGTWKGEVDSIYTVVTTLDSQTINGKVEYKFEVDTKFIKLKTLDAIASEKVVANSTYLQALFTPTLENMCYNVYPNTDSYYGKVMTIGEGFDWNKELRALINVMKAQGCINDSEVAALDPDKTYDMDNLDVGMSEEPEGATEEQKTRVKQENSHLANIITANIDGATVLQHLNIPLILEMTDFNNIDKFKGYKLFDKQHPDNWSNALWVKEMHYINKVMQVFLNGENSKVLGSEIFLYGYGSSGTNIITDDEMEVLRLYVPYSYALQSMLTSSLNQVGVDLTPKNLEVYTDIKFERNSIITDAMSANWTDFENVMLDARNSEWQLIMDVVATQRARMTEIRNNGQGSDFNAAIADLGEEPTIDASHEEIVIYKIKRGMIYRAVQYNNEDPS